MCLKRGLPSLVSTVEELLERKKVAAPVWNAEITADPTSLSTKLALTSPTSCGRSVSKVRLPNKATEFILLVILFWI
jgi:hypothetical protein